MSQAAVVVPVKRSFLARCTSGTLETPPLVLVYGVPGVGKSTLGCSIRRAAVIPIEDGTNQINVYRRFPVPESWTEVREMVQELIDGEHDCSALVIDTLDALEGLLFAQVCREGKGETIGKAHGGFGNGIQAAVDKWREFLAQLARLREKRTMTVVLLAHSAVRTFHNPDGPDYDRFIPKMNEKSWGVFFEKSDAVLFAHYETTNSSTDLDEKGKAMTTGRRFLRTQQTGAWEAKNRFGLPASIPLVLENGWDAIAGFLAAPNRLRSEIESVLASVKEPELVTTVRAWLHTAGNNATELAAGLDRLRARIVQPATTTTPSN